MSDRREPLIMPPKPLQVSESGVAVRPSVRPTSVRPSATCPSVFYGMRGGRRRRLELLHRCYKKVHIHFSSNLTTYTIPQCAYGEMLLCEPEQGCVAVPLVALCYCKMLEITDGIAVLERSGSFHTRFVSEFYPRSYQAVPLHASGQTCHHGAIADPFASFAIIYTLLKFNSAFTENTSPESQ